MNRELGQEGENLIKRFEKLRFVAYMPTPHDKPTIGWGHTDGVEMGDKIDEEQAEEFFKQDTSDAINCVNKNIKIEITQYQFDALVSLCFNIGCYNFRNSTLVRELNAGRYESASREFLKWNKQRQNGVLVVLDGLTRRRGMERALFILGAANA